ncbi:hypothetical protein FKP32DRAFT_845612 [Trametes sanguinea]|nr:hypothetical protein FKP32DRAFT_845612 [Trametes sanguinea]
MMTTSGLGLGSCLHLYQYAAHAARLFLHEDRITAALLTGRARSLLTLGMRTVVPTFTVSSHPAYCSRRVLSIPTVDRNAYPVQANSSLVYITVCRGIIAQRSSLAHDLAH